MRPREEDWAPALGADPYKTPDPKKGPRTTKNTDTLGNLVRDFHDMIVISRPMSLNSQTNGPALSKTFRKLLDAGHTYNEIRLMIKQFGKDIAVKPLTDGIPAWSAFIGRLDGLSAKVKTAGSSYKYDGPKIDPRLGGSDAL